MFRLYALEDINVGYEVDIKHYEEKNFSFDVYQFESFLFRDVILLGLQSI